MFLIEKTTLATEKRPRAGMICGTYEAQIAGRWHPIRPFWTCLASLCPVSQFQPHPTHN